MGKWSGNRERTGVASVMVVALATIITLLSALYGKTTQEVEMCEEMGRIQYKSQTRIRQRVRSGEG